MHSSRPRAVASRFAAMAIVLLFACHAGEPRAAIAAEEPARESAGASHATAQDRAGPFDAELLRIAREYRSWKRVSDEAHWSPFDCVAPRPSGVLPSRSQGDSPHGRKLYYLFVKDPGIYRELDVFEVLDAQQRESVKERLIGQALVKESWLPVEVAVGDVPRLEASDIVERLIPADYVIDGDRAFRAGEQTELFVMYKLDPSMPGTDEGWVYGTLSADGQRVTSAGRVESCMNCHATTGRDRLYGHPRMRGPEARAGQASLRSYFEETR